MVTEEDYFMLKDLAREQEQATGRVNISELARVYTLTQFCPPGSFLFAHPLHSTSQVLYTGCDRTLFLITHI